MTQSEENTANKSKWFVATFCLVVLCALATPSAVMADEWNKATKLTFSEPIAVPGLVLPEILFRVARCPIITLKVGAVSGF